MAWSAISPMAAAQVPPTHDHKPPALEPSSADSSPDAAGSDAERSVAEFPARLAARVGVANGLTSQDVAQRAVTVSSTLRIRESHIDASEAVVRLATLSFLPQVVLEGRYTRASDVDPVPLANGNLVATQAPTGPVNANQLFSVPSPAIDTPNNSVLLRAGVTVPLSGYLYALPRGRESVLSHRAALVSLRESSVLEVRTAAIVAYYGWALARLQTVVAEQAVVLAELRQQDSERGQAAGRLTQADVLSADARTTETSWLLKQAQDLEEAAADRLRVLMHDEDNRDYEIGEDLLAVSGADPVQDVSHYIRLALRQRRDLLALEQDARAAELRADAARADYLPSVALFGNAYYARPNPRFIPPQERFDATWDAGVAVQWQLTEAMHINARVDEHHAHAAALRSEAVAMGERIRAEVLNAYQRLARAQKQFEAARRNVLSAEETWRGDIARFQVGRRTSEDVTRVETSLTRARLELVQASIESRLAAVEFERSLGGTAH